MSTKLIFKLVMRCFLKTSDVYVGRLLSSGYRFEIVRDGSGKYSGSVFASEFHFYMKPAMI